MKKHDNNEQNEFLTLRRKNAGYAPNDSQLYIDTETNEIVSGNPDLAHYTNKNLKEIKEKWTSGQCRPEQPFYSKNDDNDPSAPSITIEI
jgi:hypothetical protein